MYQTLRPDQISILYLSLEITKIFNLDNLLIILKDGD